MRHENGPEFITRVLLLEDDGLLQEQLVSMMNDRSYCVRAVKSPEDALAILGSGWEPSVVVIDLFLPTSEVLGVGRALRSNCAVPVLVVVPGSDDRMLAGETSPRVHVLRRPLTSAQILGHIERVMTRRTRLAIPAIGSLSYVPGTLACTIGRERIDLGSDEALLLEQLMLHAGTVVSRSDLFALLAGFHRDLDLRIVDVYLVRLMVKIGSKHGVSVRLSSNRAGYILAVDEVDLSINPATFSAEGAESLSA